MNKGSVLISGAGIAGCALAYWLLRHGFAVTLIERAPRLRTGGYIIDFWGVGYDIVGKMGLLPDVRRAGYDVREVCMVDRQGKRVGGFDADVFRHATGDRYTSLLRDDLAHLLYGSVEGRVEAIFDDFAAALEQDADGVLVRFERFAPRRFDVVVGADGLHSTVRTLAFGPESEFERFLGYTAAAFSLSGYRPRDEDVYVGYGIPGRQVGRFAIRDDRTMFLLVSADDRSDAGLMMDRASREAYLKERFSGIGWECDRIMELLESAQDLYFDRVSQIRMKRWSNGRIALVGDAAFCPSLLAGEGSALAILGAYVLAGELSRSATPREAMLGYEERLRRFLLDKQNAAVRFAGSFAPKTTIGLFLRNRISRMLGLAPVAELMIGRSLRDDIELPEYARSDAPS
jgi:2-polyprenyl-6-methoxyphenol hydroxylase-like FAD-dependent oxidoreductase